MRNHIHYSQENVKYNQNVQMNDNVSKFYIKLFNTWLVRNYSLMTIQITFSLFRYFFYPLTKIWRLGPHRSLSQVWLKLFLESRLSPLEK